jgi:hypothetical protein
MCRVCDIARLWRPGLFLYDKHFLVHAMFDEGSLGEFFTHTSLARAPFDNVSCYEPVEGVRFLFFGECYPV